jgi:outer membrane protein
MLLGVSPLTAAEESAWFATLGLSTISFSSSADLKGPQGEIPGATMDIPDTQTLVAELGYSLTPAVDLRFLLGVPPTLRAEGRGSLKAAGTLMEARIAPAMLSVTYQFNRNGNIRPYVGAGVAYIMFLSTSDGAIANAQADDRFGQVLQAGVEVPLDGAWSVVLDARQLYWKTTASGNVPALGGMPVSADLQPDPLMFTLGLSRRF